MLNDINKPFEMTSEEKDLDEIFHGEKKPLHPDTVYETFSTPTTGTEKKVSANTTATAKAAQNPARKPVKESCMDAEYQPVKSSYNWLDNLKDCVKWAALFGGLCMLFFYWQQTGQMASSAAVPSMCVCCGLAGLGVGMSAVRGNR